MLSNSNIINSEKNSNILHDSNKIEKKNTRSSTKKIYFNEIIQIPLET
jgi:hypothetical protein